MGKGYLLSIYRNAPKAENLAEYAPAAKTALEGAGGRFIVRASPQKTYENGLNERTVVIEFDTIAAAIAAYESPEYQDALSKLGAVDRDIRLIEGV